MHSGRSPAAVLTGHTHRRFFPLSPDSCVPRPRGGFTLVEMLGVMTIAAILLGLIAPAVVQIGGGRDLTRHAYDISGLLEEARAYAKANSTYTWVGFYEEAADQTAGTAGVGRIIVSVVASKDASTLFTNTASNPNAWAAANLVQVGNLTKLPNLHLDTLSQTAVPARTAPLNDAYQVGSVDFAQQGLAPAPAPQFTYPIGSTAPTYTFTKVIQFNPLGDATRVLDTPQPEIEIGLRPAQGSTANTGTKDLAVVQVAGIAGQVRIYQP